MPYISVNDKRVKELIKNGSKGAKLNDYWTDIPQVNNMSKRKSGNIHPCPLPVKLVERIILITTNPGDMVIDPFAGSSTTAIACLNTGRRFVGFEMDKLYFEYSCKRIAEHVEFLKFTSQTTSVA